MILRLKHARIEKIMAISKLRKAIGRQSRRKPPCAARLSIQGKIRGVVSTVVEFSAVEMYIQETPNGISLFRDMKLAPYLPHFKRFIGRRGMVVLRRYRKGD
jgi:hypothetical protein